MVYMINYWFFLKVVLLKCHIFCPFLLVIKMNRPVWWKNCLNFDWGYSRIKVLWLFQVASRDITSAYWIEVLWYTVCLLRVFLQFALQFGEEIQNVFYELLICHITVLLLLVFLYMLSVLFFCRITWMLRVHRFWPKMKLNVMRLNVYEQLASSWKIQIPSK